MFNIAVITILFRCCIASYQCRVPGVIFRDAPSILKICFAQGFSMSILFPKTSYTFEMVLHFGFNMKICNRFVQRPFKVQMTLVSCAFVNCCAIVVVGHLHIISPRMCNHHIIKHFQRFVIAFVSLCEHFGGVCLSLSIGVSRWQQTCIESAEFWPVYQAHHDGLFGKNIRNMWVIVDLLHCYSHPETICIISLAMLLTKHNLFPLFRACDLKSCVDNPSMCHFGCSSHLGWLVRISFVCAYLICFEFSARKKLKTNAHDADGPGVGTCPCDRCCPALGLEAHGTMVLKLVDTFGVMKNLNLDILRCTAVFLVRTFLSEIEKNLVLYISQTINFIPPRMCHRHIIKHFQRFVIAFMSLCEHFMGVCLILSIGLSMRQQTCIKSAKFWSDYHAHHDGLFEKTLRSMWVKVDLLHHYTNPETICTLFLAMLLTQPNLFISFIAYEHKGRVDNPSMYLSGCSSHLGWLVGISFFCAYLTCLEFSAKKKLKTDAPDADGPGVGTCPCDRCCPALGLEANGTLGLKLVDTPGVMQNLNLGIVRCTAISLVRAFLSEIGENSWYNSQTIIFMVTRFVVHNDFKDHLVNFEKKLKWHFTSLCAGQFTCLVYLKFWFMIFSRPEFVDIADSLMHLPFSHCSPMIEGLGFVVSNFLFNGIPLLPGVQKTVNIWLIDMMYSILTFGIWIARGIARQRNMVQHVLVWGVSFGYPFEILQCQLLSCLLRWAPFLFSFGSNLGSKRAPQKDSPFGHSFFRRELKEAGSKSGILQLTGRIGKTEKRSCWSFLACLVQVLMQTVTRNLFGHCIEKIHAVIFHCRFRVLPVSCSVVCLTCGLTSARNLKMYRTQNSKLTRESLVNAILAFFPLIDDLRYPAYLRPKHISFAFDSSLGFPGEGPDKWTCITANVESLATHPHYLNWQDDAQILQEIRVAQSNYDDFKFKLKPSNRLLHCSRLLELKQQKNAVYRIPHGGTGIIAPQALLQPFCASDDITGKWEEIACTTRVTGAWIQVQPKLKILVFSFYGHTCHTDKEEEIHELNNRILSVLFEISTQFGDVPIIIGGDFQKEPETFDAFQQAKMHKGWVDPIAREDEHGNIIRPITFSRSGNFINPADSTSSLDALLLNESAAAALESIEVIVGDARQHAPIRASFCWPKIYQTGYILVRPAPMNFSNLVLGNGKPDQNLLQNVAHTLWNQKFSEKCANPDDTISWKSINQYGIEILQKCGAEFGKGPKTRGCKPQFREKTICPGQNKDGSAIVTASASLSKTHSLIAELSHRLQRKSEKQADMDVTFQLQKKVEKIVNNPMFPGWNSERHLNCDTLGVIQKILQKEISVLRSKEKYDRVKKWRAQMKEGTATKNVDKQVFQWVRQKQTKPSPNLIVGQDDHVIYNPIDAIGEINSQWDSVYSVNALHDDPMNILACVWPHIQKYRNPIDLPPP